MRGVCLLYSDSDIHSKIKYQCFIYKVTLCFQKDGNGNLYCSDPRYEETYFEVWRTVNSFRNTQYSHTSNTHNIRIYLNVSKFANTTPPLVLAPNKN